MNVGTTYKCWNFHSLEDQSMVQTFYLESFPVTATNTYTNKALPCRKELCLLADCCIMQGHH